MGSRYYYRGPGRRGLSRGGSELGGMKPGPTTLLGASIVSGWIYNRSVVVVVCLFVGQADG